MSLLKPSSKDKYLHDDMNALLHISTGWRLVTNIL